MVGFATSLQHVRNSQKAFNTFVGYLRDTCNLEEVGENIFRPLDLDRVTRDLGICTDDMHGPLGSAVDEITALQELLYTSYVTLDALVCVRGEGNVLH